MTRSTTSSIAGIGTKQSPEVSGYNPGESPLSDIVPGKYLSRKLREKLPLQLRQTRDLAALTVAAGPESVAEWLKLDFDEHAPTPTTYHERSKRPRNSVYLLDESHGAWSAVFTHGAAYARALVQCRAKARPWSNSLRRRSLCSLLV